MSGITFSNNDLNHFIEHHIALLERFGIKDEVPFSLIFFSLENKQEMDCLQMFQNILRKTDAIFNHSNHYVVMLTGTDWNGATEVLKGVQEFLDQEPVDTIVCYPEDGTSAQMLLQKLNQIVEDQCNITSEFLTRM
ncbi:hypothetical protein [Sulfurospirillum deleyianum]|uniref:Uncharacterized protein n=1 Tax=Sulfurospirillum deleyianum (strain ATCC 51133 / DSM 6946 / 5175) TaxID=525898 RepID=D1B2T6_SULD5|nr:hypothetical protein [Sulfurospirillum deleyianum]ACZ12406.1 conserved hypothetical protein [Sulfurospirillum deleyianum DSM 6946]